MGNNVKGTCALCGNPLLFRALMVNQEVSADTLMECVKNDDFADLYITENAVTSTLEYRCTNEGCAGGLSESDGEILEGIFHPVNVSR
jgi:hypothetical protein